MNYRDAFNLLKDTFAAWVEDKATRLAAALAYYMVFSLAPLLLVAIAIAGAVFGEQAATGKLFGQIQGIVGTEAARLIEDAISNASRPDLSSFASVLSVVVLVFGASGVFAQLQDALNTIWHVEPPPLQGWQNVLRLISKRLLSFAMVLLMGIFLIVFLLLSTAVTALSRYGPLLGFSFIWQFDFLWKFLSFSVSFFTIALLIATLYRFLPDARVAWNDVWIGSLITSVLFSVGKSAIGLYLGAGSLGSTYGAAGSLVVLLAWIYYSAQIFFLGAEFTQVYARQFGSAIVPQENTLPFPKRTKRVDSASDRSPSRTPDPPKEADGEE